MDIKKQGNRKRKRNAFKHKTFIKNLEFSKKCRHCKEPLSSEDKLSGVSRHVECSIEAYLKSKTSPVKQKRKFIRPCKNCNEPIEHTYLGFDTYVRDLCSHCHKETATNKPEDLRMPVVQKNKDKHLHANIYCCKIN